MSEVNGRNGYIKWGIVGTGGAIGLPAVIAAIATLLINPVEKQLAKIETDNKAALAKIETDYKAAVTELKLEARDNAAEIRRIGSLSAERGILMPGMAADIKRLEDKFERFEQTLRSKP